MLNHDVFYNRERSGYDELTSYQPLYWRQIKEMRANNKFAGLTTECMARDLERVVLDQFFDTCSEEMIQREMDFLQLTDYENLSIEDRRNLLKVSWIGNQKMSGTRIKALVMAYCGCSARVKFTHSLYIIANAMESTSVIYIGHLQSILSQKLPAHLSYYAIVEVATNDIKIGRSISYWIYDYEKCGTSPDVSTLGEAIETDFDIDTEVNDYLYDYSQTGTVVAGTIPNTGTIGVDIETGIDVSANSEGYTYDYSKTGNVVSGTTPDISTLGLAMDSPVRIGADAKDYIYDIKQASSES